VGDHGRPAQEATVTLPIFERDATSFFATAMARGPWDPGHCHGGAPASLLAALIDATPAPAPMQVVRLTFDLARPVPVGAPLDVDVRVVREGRRVQLLDADLTDRDGTSLAHVRALRMRTGEVEVPASAGEDAPPLSPSPHDLPRFLPDGGWTAEGFWSAVDVRFVAGDLGAPGPGTAWFRVTTDLADGVALTPAARVAAAADFGNGIGSPLPIDRFLYINPDLTIGLHRLPTTEWVAIAASSVAQAAGVGLTTSVVYDEHGRIGQATQSLFVAASGAR
jgi:acyl-coenzyme A thioesterase PaaI-like protein